MIENELFVVEGTIEEDISEGSELESTRPSKTFRTFESPPPTSRPAPTRGVTRGGSDQEHEYDPHDIHFGSRTGSLRTKNEVSHFSIGMPVVHALEDLIATTGSIPLTIRHQLEAFEFHWVELACSFVAAPSHTFQTAKFEITLVTKNVASIVPISHPAMAYSLFPERLEDEYSYKQTVGLTPELKITAGPLGATVPLPNIERSTSGSTYKASVEAYGLQDTTCGWVFACNVSHALSGTHRMYLLLRKPRGTEVRALFDLTASVQKQSGALHFLKMKYTSISGGIVDMPNYSLC